MAGECYTVESMPLKISIDEKFPHLTKAPITEAVFEVRSRAEAAWDEKNIAQRLKEALPDYPTIEPRRAFQSEVSIKPDVPIEQKVEDLGWQGFQMRTADKKQLARFELNLFLFSRVTPYPGWVAFESEALRLWDVHCRIAQPGDVERLGLRFINHIPLNERGQVGHYFTLPIQGPAGLPLPGDFLHKDLLEFEGYNYIAQVTRVMQGTQLILDIDVASKAAFTYVQKESKRMLAEMRWIKNKVFFGSIKPAALKEFE